MCLPRNACCYYLGVSLPRDNFSKSLQPLPATKLRQRKLHQKLTGSVSALGKCLRKVVKATGALNREPLDPREGGAHSAMTICINKKYLCLPSLPRVAYSPSYNFGAPPCRPYRHTNPSSTPSQSPEILNALSLSNRTLPESGRKWPKRSDGLEVTWPLAYGSF